MQKWAVFHLISKLSLNIVSFVFSSRIINEFEKKSYSVAIHMKAVLKANFF